MWVLLSLDPALVLIRLPKHIDHVPILILNCNEEFEEDGVNRARLLKQVCVSMCVCASQCFPIGYFGVLAWMCWYTCPFETNSLVWLLEMGTSQIVTCNHSVVPV